MLQRLIDAEIFINKPDLSCREIGFHGNFQRVKSLEQNESEMGT